MRRTLAQMLGEEDAGAAGGGSAVAGNASFNPREAPSMVARFFRVAPRSLSAVADDIGAPAAGPSRRSHQPSGLIPRPLSAVVGAGQADVSVESLRAPPFSFREPPLPVGPPLSESFPSMGSTGPSLPSCLGASGSAPQVASLCFEEARAAPTRPRPLPSAWADATGTPPLRAPHPASAPPQQTFSTPPSFPPPAPALQAARPVGQHSQSAPVTAPAGAPAPRYVIMPSRAELITGFRVPPPSPLGERLRARIATRTRRRFMSSAAENAYDLRRRALHVAGLLPDAAITRVLDAGLSGSAAEIPAAQRVPAAAKAISQSAGRSGESLQSKLACMAKLADFAAVGGFGSFRPLLIFDSVVSPSVISEYLTWERARGFVQGSVGTAKSALADLRFCASHLGLLAVGLDSDVVAAAAADSVDHDADPEPTRHAGSVPLRLQAGREALANSRQGRGPADHSEVIWVWVCCRIIAFVFGLRKAEMRSARIIGESDSRVIAISFFPKGDVSKSRIKAYRWAFGVLGPFLWWPRFLKAMGKSSTLTPGFDTGSVLRATRLSGSIAPKGTRAAVDLLTIPSYGISAEAVKSLDITEHSDHGSLNDVIRSLGATCALDVVQDCLVAGHWLGASSARGAAGSSSRASRSKGGSNTHAAANEAVMVARYGADAPRLEGPSVVWRALAPAFYAIREQNLSWAAIPSSDGWSAARKFALSFAESGQQWRIPSEPPFGDPAGSPFPPPAESSVP